MNTSKMNLAVEKMIANIKNSKLIKELKEFDNLIRAIGECKSKSEEDRIIAAEIQLLKQRLSDPKLDKSRGREYMVRVIYCEMLGHDASFAYITALQFASDSNLLTKKAAYLALTQLLDHNSELVLLLVNTLLSDLKSDNYIIVSTALVVAAKLIGPDLVNAVYPVVLEKLRHPKENVRKKAVMCLQCFHQMDPKREGPLAGVDLERSFRTMLCDKDPSVMSASLCALHDCVKMDPRPYKNLVPSFTSILKQVFEHRLPKTYDYHRFPAPFIQIKLLKILAALGAGDRSASENMHTIVLQCLRRAAGSTASGTAGVPPTIASALVYECVRTITTIFPNAQLLTAAGESISPFLKSPNRNLKYVGLDALAGIVQVNASFAQEHQLAVVDCLEDSDDSLKLKTLELLYNMTRPSSVDAIVERMLVFLSTTADDHIRSTIVRQITDLAEKYAPSPMWFLKTITTLLKGAGDLVDDSAVFHLCRLIAQQDESLHRHAAAVYVDLLTSSVGSNGGAGGGSISNGGDSMDVIPLPSSSSSSCSSSANNGNASANAAAATILRKLPEQLLKVVFWVLGEFGHLGPIPVGVLARRLSAILNLQGCGDGAKGFLITALTKLAARTAAREGGGRGSSAGGSGGSQKDKDDGEMAVAALLGSECRALLHRAACSQNVDLQQRSLELLALVNLPSNLMVQVLPEDDSPLVFDESELDAVRRLDFLDPFVQQSLAKGAAPYCPPTDASSSNGSGADKGLRFDAYESTQPIISGGGGGYGYSTNNASTTAASSSSSSGALISSGGAAPTLRSGSGFFGNTTGSSTTTTTTTTTTTSNGTSNSNSSTNSNSSSNNSTASPQLVLRHSTSANRKWGPAQFMEGPSPHASSSPNRNDPFGSGVGGGAVSGAPSGGQNGMVGGGAAPIPKPITERDRLAASLFGLPIGGAGSGGIGAGAAGPGSRMVGGGSNGNLISMGGGGGGGGGREGSHSRSSSQSSQLNHSNSFQSPQNLSNSSNSNSNSANLLGNGNFISAVASNNNLMTNSTPATTAPVVRKPIPDFDLLL